MSQHNFMSIEELNVRCKNSTQPDCNYYTYPSYGDPMPTNVTMF